MNVLIMGFLKAAMLFGSGVGAASMIDKFFPDKLPAGIAPLTNVKDGSGKINWMKIGLIILVGAIGIMVTRYIGKKLNVSILK